MCKPNQRAIYSTSQNEARLFPYLKRHPSSNVTLKVGGSCSAEVKELGVHWILCSQTSVWKVILSESGQEQLRCSLVL